MLSIPLSPNTQNSQTEGNHIFYTPLWTWRDRFSALFWTLCFPQSLAVVKFSLESRLIPPAAVSGLVSSILSSVAREKPLRGDHSCSLGSRFQHPFLLNRFFLKGNHNPSYCSPCILSHVASYASKAKIPFPTRHLIALREKERGPG